MPGRRDFDDATVQDLVNTAMLRIFQALGAAGRLEGDSEAAARAYLKGALRTTALDLLRRRKRERAHLVSLRDAAGQEFDVPDRGADPESTMVAQEFIEAESYLFDTIARLGVDRAPVRLRESRAEQFGELRALFLGSIDRLALAHRRQERVPDSTEAQAVEFVTKRVQRARAYLAQAREGGRAGEPAALSAALDQILEALYERTLGGGVGP